MQTALLASLCIYFRFLMVLVPLGVKNCYRIMFMLIIVRMSQ